MKTFKYKLYDNKRKFKYLNDLLIIACDIYNFSLACKQNAYKKDKTNILKNDLQKILKLEKYKHKTWINLGSQVIQQITERIDRGYNLFFLALKARTKNEKYKKISPPKFKKYSKYKSITFKQSGYKLNTNNSIRIGEKTFKFHKDREIQGNIKTLTVKKNKLGEFFIYITTDYVEPVKNIPQSGNKIGFDFGLSTFLTANTSKEDDIISPLFFKENIKIIRKLSRSLSKKKKGSNNWKRTILKLNRVHKKITNKRENYHWKLATYLIKKYDVIFVETLDIEVISKLFGKKIGDLGFSNFFKKLKYQAIKYNKKIVQIDKWYPSSKTCSNCLYYNSNLDKYTKDWTCPKCGMKHNRDRNAAKNIFRVGISTLAGDYIRPSFEKAIIDNRKTPIL